MSARVPSAAQWGLIGFEQKARAGWADAASQRPAAQMAVVAERRSEKERLLLPAPGEVYISCYPIFVTSAPHEQGTFSKQRQLGASNERPHRTIADFHLLGIKVWPSNPLKEDIRKAVEMQDPVVCPQTLHSDSALTYVAPRVG